MDWSLKIKTWYEAGIWTAEMVQNAVTMRKITESQTADILAEFASNACRL